MKGLDLQIVHRAESPAVEGERQGDARVIRLCTHTHSHTYSHAHIHIHTHSHTLSLSLTHTHTHTHPVTADDIVSRLKALRLTSARPG
jgi:hypothetical protein